MRSGRRGGRVGPDMRADGSAAVTLRELLEDYFLGVIPEAVLKACRKEKEKRIKAPGTDE